MVIQLTEFIDNIGVIMNIVGLTMREIRALEREANKRAREEENENSDVVEVSTEVVDSEDKNIQDSEEDSNE